LCEAQCSSGAQKSLSGSQLCLQLALHFDSQQHDLADRNKLRRNNSALRCGAAGRACMTTSETKFEHGDNPALRQKLTYILSTPAHAVLIGRQAFGNDRTAVN
jgi:hypothetical protein